MRNAAHNFQFAITQITLRSNSRFHTLLCARAGAKEQGWTWRDVTWQPPIPFPNYQFLTFPLSSFLTITIAFLPSAKKQLMEKILWHYVKMGKILWPVKRNNSYAGITIRKHTISTFIWTCSGNDIQRYYFMCFSNLFKSGPYSIHLADTSNRAPC